MFRHNVQSTSVLLSNVHDTLLSLHGGGGNADAGEVVTQEEERKKTPTNTNKCTAVIVIRNDFSFEWAKSDCSQFFLSALHQLDSHTKDWRAIEHRDDEQKSLTRSPKDGCKERTCERWNEASKSMR